jgi:hypothetical protein
MMPFSQIVALAILPMLTARSDAQAVREPASGFPSGRAGTFDANGSVGQLPKIAIGGVGQRQASDQAVLSINPGGRIEARINNRVASRLNSRGGGNGSQIDTFAAYGAANEETISTNRKVRR